MSSIRKATTTLINPIYNTPSTSLVMFHFEPEKNGSIEERLKKCHIEHRSVQGKDIYIFDNFFTSHEGEEIRTFSKTAEFSKTIYADSTSQSQGEEPAQAMDNKEKWRFFAAPPEEIKELYRLLSLMALHLDADISTLPWDISDGHISASAIASNRISRLNKESMHLGAHEDYNTEKGIPFAIPILYQEPGSIYPKSFVNGAPGQPWFISLMVYATDANFKPEFGLGTAFFENKQKIALQSECRHLRFVLFEGDILHGIQESSVPEGTHTFRVSYVFKLLLNPCLKEASLKKQFYQWLTTFNLEEK